MSPRNALNGAQVIVDYLIQQKVPQVFGLCEHGNIQLIDALYLTMLWDGGATGQPDVQV